MPGGSRGSTDGLTRRHGDSLAKLDAQIKQERSQFGLVCRQWGDLRELRRYRVDKRTGKQWTVNFDARGDTQYGQDFRPHSYAIRLKNTTGKCQFSVASFRY